MAINDNIKKHRQAARLSQPALARLCGWESQSRVSNYETGLRAPSTSDLQAIANALNIDIGLLINDYANDDFNQLSQRLSMIPLISWVQAGMLCQVDHVFDKSTAEEWRYCHVKHSEHTYALTIVGDSMSPEYLDGCDIYVDPQVMPEHNDDVIVCTPDGKATFKRLQITNDGQYLLAINPDFPNRIIEVPEGSIICGVVIYSGKPTKRMK
jgi:SOS-response transcriptional repressor LexA